MKRSSVGESSKKTPKMNPCHTKEFICFCHPIVIRGCSMGLVDIPAPASHVLGCDWPLNVQFLEP